MSQRHLRQERRLAEPSPVEARVVETIRGRTPSEGFDSEPVRRRSILARVIAAIAVVVLAAFLLNGRGSPLASRGQNVHPPVAPTHITPDGLPGRPRI